MNNNHHQLNEMSFLRRFLEYLVRIVVFYSVGMYLLELEINDTKHSIGFWLWNERLVAIFFTLEYFFRWYYSDNKYHYPFKILSIIDLVSILPFYIGFFVNSNILGIIRTLRVLRLFKLIRYNPFLLNVLSKIYKIKNDLLIVGYIVIIFIVLSSVMILQFEQSEQPDKFSKPSDALWWSLVTMATVGYGDLSPITIGGRIVATFTMIGGIGIFGVFVSLIGNAFMNKD
jgi:voltage-gated potassium channel